MAIARGRKPRAGEVRSPTKGAEMAQVRAAMTHARAKTARKRSCTCDDCFFRRNLLCALDLEEPCPTFRPDGPHGLVPPQQPILLAREA